MREWISESVIRNTTDRRSGDEGANSTVPGYLGDCFKLTEAVTKLETLPLRDDENLGEIKIWGETKSRLN
jgi:hypothetical protein